MAVVRPGVGRLSSVLAGPLTSRGCRRRIQGRSPEGEWPVVVIHRLDTSEATALFTNTPPEAAMTPSQWRSFCLEGGLLAFAAEDEGQFVGLALAESHPRVVKVLAVAGREDACRLLLERLVRLAGERDMSAWCPAARV